MKDLFGSAQGDRINSDDVAIEMQSAGDSGSGSSEMKSFFSEIATINNQIATFQGNVSRIQELHSKNLTAVSEEEMARYSSDIDKLVDESNSIANRLRNTLKAMDKSNEAFEAKNPGSGDARIRKSQHAMQSKKFVEVLQNYQQIQSENKEKYQKRMARQIRIVKPDATEEEVSNIMKDGSKSLFALQIAPDSQLAQANETLRRMEERHIEIEKLERSIIELHQLFVDMAVLVDQQSHMIANIDTYVSNAVQYTNKAAENLRKANNSQKKSRKRMCCIMICAIVFIVILVAVLGGSGIFKIGK